MSEYLAVFSITPVQSFISHARKLRDFYVGSKILSHLAKTGLLKALGDEVAGNEVYPSKESDSVPNKFVFTLDANEAQEVITKMKLIEGAVQDEWLYLAGFVGVPHDLIDDYWQYSWAAVPLNGADYSQIHSKVQALLAATKLKPNRIRKPQRGKKCPLCGENSVWKTITDSSEKKEDLCGVCAIKRLLPQKSIPKNHPLYELTQQENFPITTELAAHRYIAENKLSEDDIQKLHEDDDSRLPNKQKYYALLIMDGDRMGDLVNTKTTPEEHRKLADDLEHFTKSIPHKFDNGGRLIYAGGDDVCAVMPLDGALDEAENIRESYKKFIYDGTRGTISAALIITHHKEPLREVIRDAHTALDEIAKDKADRDALVIRLKKRSGGDRDVCFKWDAPNEFFKTETLFESFKIISALVAEKDITTNLIYRLSTLKPALFDGKGKQLLDDAKTLKMFVYETSHSFPKTVDIENTAKRLAGLCISKTGKGGIEFNAEAPVIAHFLAGTVKHEEETNGNGV